MKTIGSPSLSLTDVRTFVTVVDCGGIARAAKILGYSQPAVTLQIQRLERRFGVCFFERRGRRLRLTATGQHALEASRELLRQVTQFESAASRIVPSVNESLLVAAIDPTASTKLGPILHRLRRRLSNLDLKVETLGSDNISKAAQAGNIHAALTVPTHIAGWVYEPLFSERLVALVPSKHVLAKHRSISLARLCSEPLLLTDETCFYRRAIERAFLRRHLRLKPVMQTSSLLALPNAVVAGVGIAIVPRDIPFTNDASLKLIAIRDPIEVMIGLLRPQQVPANSALEYFIAEANMLRRRKRRDA